MKTCSRCHQTKEFSGFYFRRKGERAGEYYNHCKDCLKSRGRSYYHHNHERQLRLSNDRNRTNRKNQRDFVSSLKNRPCVDCGRNYPPCVMDFDHRDGNHKRGNIGSLVSQAYFTKEGLLREIGKCDLVCSNCHRIRTHLRRHQFISSTIQIPN